MMASEFKAWFEGYAEGIEGQPTKAQFDRVKEQVKEISGTPITQTVFVEKYAYPYWRNEYHQWLGYGGAAGLVARGIGQSVGNISYSAGAVGQNKAAENFDSHAAMYALGKAESVN